MRPPAPLDRLPCWLLWQSRPQQGGKPLKVPLWAHGEKRSAKHGSPVDKQYLTTWEKAFAAAPKREASGLGFAPLAELGLLVLDLDDSHRDGRTHPAALPLTAGTWTEVSPGGRGLHAIWDVSGLPPATLEAIGNRKRLKPDPSAPFGIECFRTAGFVTWTGRRLPDSPPHIAPMSGRTAAALLALLDSPATATAARPASDGPFLGLEPPVSGIRADGWARRLSLLDPDMKYPEWIQVGMGLHHQYRGEETGLDLWDGWSSRSEKYPGRGALAEFWAGFSAAPDRAHVTGRTILHMVKCATTPQADPASAHSMLVPADEYSERPSPPWAVPGVLPAAGLAMLYGASGTGKTFVLLDLMARMACGMPWQDSPTTAGLVVYVCSEGRGGLPRRLQAWQQTHAERLHGGRMLVVDEPVDLMDEKSLGRLLAAIGGLGRPVKAIALDTWAGVTPTHDENDTADCKAAVTACERLLKASGGLMLLSHHSGKDPTRGARGSSVLRAAVDVELTTSKDKDGTRELLVTKSRDGDDGQSWRFRLERVQVGVGEDGLPLHSCVVDYGALGVAQQPSQQPEPELVRGPDELEQQLLRMLHGLGPRDSAAIVRMAAARKLADKESTLSAVTRLRDRGLLPKEK